MGQAARAAVSGLAGLLAACVGPAVDAEGIDRATYEIPSTVYAHDALGSGHEWAALTLHGAAGSQSYQDPDIIFEDTAPRLADLDGDGDNEAVVIESSLTQGSRLAVWSGQGRIAATPFIGRRHRWLAPVGAADFDGDGRVEIAYVETPHLGKVLKIVRLEGDRLVPVAEMAGLTNHKFAEAQIQGGITDCGGQPTILTANADWTRVMGTTLDQGKLASRDLGPYRGPESFDHASCE